MDIVKDLFKLLASEGIQVPAGTDARVETTLRQLYGGERVYVRSLPKLDKQVRIEAARASFGTATTASLRDLQRVTGMPLRTIKRIKNGR